MADIELFFAAAFSLVIEIVKSGVLYEFEAPAIVFLCAVFALTPGVKPKADTVFDC